MTILDGLRRKMLTGILLPERCIFEQVIFDHMWSHRGLDL